VDVDVGVRVEVLPIEIEDNRIRWSLAKNC